MSHGRRCLAGAVLGVFLVGLHVGGHGHAGDESKDPAAWGSDHVGQPVPRFTSGDECLFCHRMDVGPTWSANRHNRTVRSIDPQSPALVLLRETPELKALASEVEFLLGDKLRQRLLKSNGHGKLAMLSVEWQPPRAEKSGKLLNLERPHWDGDRFGAACAGCHATGVDVKEKTFASRSLDCFACHGEPPDGHTTQGSLALLARKRPDPARVVTSICAQCHLRTGRSKSTGLPYPNNFVAGDNLFRDFQVDFSDQQIKKLNPGDAHVLANVRDVVVLGKEDVTCLSCHDVHKQSAQKHHRVRTSDYCLHCHQAEGSKKIVKKYEVHSSTCGY
jgi:hypothetical protein